MQEVIRVTGLTKKYQDRFAVNQLSFTVSQGDIYGFLGQNGAGKSTTIRMLLSLISPSSGAIEIFGKDLLPNRNEILRKVGAVVERPDLYPYLSGLENLALFAKMSGIRPSRNQLLEQLEHVGLATRYSSRVCTYSQGMKQRLGIAVALVHDPELIILDEPTNGLDPQGITDIRNLILNLSKERKKTVFVSSHLLSEIEQIATRMLIIDKGSKLAEGTVQDLLDPADSVVYLQTSNDETSMQLLRTSDYKRFIQGSDHRGIQLRMERASIPVLNRFLVERNVEVWSLSVMNRLEESFLKLTSSEPYVDAFSN